MDARQYNDPPAPPPAPPEALHPTLLEPAPAPPTTPTPEPASSGRAVWALIICCLLLGILLNWGVHHRRASHDLQMQLRAMADDYALLRARHSELGQLMVSPQIQWFALEPAGNVRFGAAIAWHPSRRDGALFLSGIDLLPAGEQYQLWIEPQDLPAVSAAVFDAPRGGTVHFIRPAQPINDIRRLFITVEPAGGNPEPSGRQVASAELS